MKKSGLDHVTPNAPRYATQENPVKQNGTIREGLDSGVWKREGKADWLQESHPQR